MAQIVLSAVELVELLAAAVAAGGILGVVLTRLSRRLHLALRDSEGVGD